jgi:oligopeptide/dipeptide ABC transporter ATP-binding protein
VILRGEVSNPINVKPGCRFAKRCDYCTEACTLADPGPVEVSPDHFVSCFLMKQEV